ncbi:MAG: lipocalin-like domain-containing protein [Chryseotalea sp. WA131a]|nr:MAG: lipocalin-like domain-containing protein [Chryseotalea sp. WA131a]
MKRLKLTLGLLTLVTIYSCNKKTQIDDRKFHGMWTLDKFELFDSLTNNWTVDTTRIGTSGYILYDGEGHMGVHLIPRGYKDFDTNKNIDSLEHDDLKQLARFYKSNFVYFANYKIHETTIDHGRLTATEPGNWGTTLVRDFVFKGDTLILTAHEKVRGQQLRLIWIKL